MDKRERKRRAAITALAQLHWLEHALGEDKKGFRLDRRMLMLAEMRVQAEEFSWQKPATPLKSAGVPMCHGTGHSGAI